MIFSTSDSVRGANVSMQQLLTLTSIIFTSSSTLVPGLTLFLIFSTFSMKKISFFDIAALPHLLMIVVHGETLWSPAPQPMDDDDE